MEFRLIASYGFTGAAGAALLSGFFATLMSVERSEKDLWRRFAVLSFINAFFCLTGTLQNAASAADVRTINAWNNAAGMLLAPAFLDFVMTFTSRRSGLVSAAAWTIGLAWSAFLVFFPDRVMTANIHLVDMPLHYFHYTWWYAAFNAALFAMIGAGLLLLVVVGLGMAERGQLVRFLFPTCAIWAFCGFWDTTLSAWLNFPMAMSWFGGLTVNVAFLIFVQRRSQRAFAIQEKHKSVMRDVNQARIIQEGLITAEMPVLKRVRIQGRYLPMDQLGGDFYNVRRLDDHRASIFLSDVSGHGIASAFITAMMKVALENLDQRHLTDPERVLSMLNDALLKNIGSWFVTGIYGILDEEKMNFTFASAGHHPPILHYQAATGRAGEVMARGRLLGAFAEIETQLVSIRLAPGDRVLLATDGIYEAFNIAGEMFGRVRFLDLFQSQVVESLDPLFAGIERFISGRRRDDDMAAILITVPEPDKAFAAAERIPA